MTNKITSTIAFLLLFTGTLCPLQAHNSQDNILQETFNGIPEGGVLKTRFTQKRHLKDIPLPLTSSGEITLWAGKGLLWKTQTPFPTTLLMTQKGLYHVQDSTKTSLLKGGKMGKEGAVFDILSKILRGDFSQITGFTASTLSELKTKTATWGVRLLPPAVMEKLIAQIHIEGTQNNNKRFISHITIQRANGDRDEIILNTPHLFAPQEIKNALTAQEQDILND